MTLAIASPACLSFSDLSCGSELCLLLLLLDRRAPLGLKSSTFPLGGGLSKPRSGSSSRLLLLALGFAFRAPLCELTCPGLGMRIDRVEDALVHAPPNIGVRFSGGDDNVVKGGKSVDCRTAGVT
jgi:hypothetical protein